MRVSEYLERSGLTVDELALAVDVKPETVKKELKRELRPSWLERLGEPPAEDAEGRASEETPRTPPRARLEADAPKVDYGSIAGYFEQGYALAAGRVRPANPLLADVILEHSAHAGQAWAHYLESNPKLAAWLERLMIGTPAGELVGVHVAMVVSYVLVRDASERIAADVRARAEGAGDNGSPEPAAADFVDFPTL